MYSRRCPTFESAGREAAEFVVVNLQLHKGRWEKRWHLGQIVAIQNQPPEFSQILQQTNQVSKFVINLFNRI